MWNIRKKAKKRKQKKSSSSEEEDDLKKKKKKKIKKSESEDYENENGKSKKSAENGVGNGKPKDITLVDLEEEMNLEELMKKKVQHIFYFISCYDLSVVIYCFYGLCNLQK